MPFGETYIDQRTDINYNTPYKFSAKEKPARMNIRSGGDDETQYSYFGARYYDSDLSAWISVDGMSDNNQGISPYNYCHWNPIVIIDPDGRDDNDPYWHDKITDQIVHTNQDSPPTTKGDWEYMGETITSIDNNGNTEYHDQYNKVHNSVSLTGPDIIDEKCNYDESAAASAFVDGYEKALYELALFWAGNEAINVACKIVAPLARMAYASLFAKTAATEGTQIIAANGSKIVGFTSHAVNRAIERGITSSSILGALKNPLKIGEVVIDDLGRASQRFIGGSAEVVVNPQTGRIIS